MNDDNPHFESSFLELSDGQRCHVLDGGSGPPLLFVHGLPGLGSDFCSIASRLAEHYRCILLDRPGYGLSSLANADRPMSIKRAAADVAEVVEQLELRGVVLVGWSYGGHIVAEVSRSHPANVRSVVLIGSAGPSINWPVNVTDRLLFRPKLGPKLLSVVKRRLPGVLKRALNNAIGEAAPQHIHEEFVAGLNRPGMVESWLREARTWAPSSMQPEAVQHPCLVLHGDRDARVSIEVARDLASRVPGATYKELAGAGHWPFLTHTDAVEAEMTAFLTACRGA